MVDSASSQRLEPLRKFCDSRYVSVVHARLLAGREKVERGRCVRDQEIYFCYKFENSSFPIRQPSKTGDSFEDSLTAGDTDR